MSVILFFGLALVILLVGGTYAFLTIRYHWGQGKNSQEKTDNKSKQDHKKP